MGGEIGRDGQAVLTNRKNIKFRFEKNALLFSYDGGVELRAFKKIPDSPYKICVEDIPPNMNEIQVRELFSTYGALKHFFPYQERTNLRLKNCCFIEYVNPDVTYAAINGISSLQF